MHQEEEPGGAAALPVDDRVELRLRPLDAVAQPGQERRFVREGIDRRAAPYRGIGADRLPQRGAMARDVETLEIDAESGKARRLDRRARQRRRRRSLSS
jgi:hypothetical protein